MAAIQSSRNVSLPVPLAAVLVRIFEAFVMSTFGGSGAGALIPQTAILMRVFETVYVTLHCGGSASMLIPGTALLM